MREIECLENCPLIMTSKGRKISPTSQMSYIFDRTVVERVIVNQKRLSLHISLNNLISDLLEESRMYTEELAVTKLSVVC